MRATGSVDELFSQSRLLVVVAHPDDETLGAAGLLWRLGRRGARVAIAHATDGAPHDMRDARAHGFHTRDAYAAAREDELRRALKLLPVKPDRFRLAYADQSLVSNLCKLTQDVWNVLRTYHPSMVLSHPYEGGHPDHDALALAVSLARNRLSDPVRHMEFTSYHLWNGQVRSGAFLRDNGPVTAVELDAATEQAKRQMLACFVTQSETLRGFDAASPELFRAAPHYDFRHPPHEPPLLYDLYPWGITSHDWMTHAAALLDAEATACG